MKYFIAIIFIIGLFPTCNKLDNEKEGEKDRLSILIGDHENMTVENIEKELYVTHYEVDTYNIDINYDGIDDYQLFYASTGNPEVDVYRISISGLNETSHYSIFYSLDSVYTSIRSDTNVHENYVHINYYSKPVCSKINPTDTFRHIENNLYVKLGRYHHKLL